MYVDGASGVRVRFRTDRFTGHVVVHCHLLDHEDRGMMAVYDILDSVPATQPPADSAAAGRGLIYVAASVASILCAALLLL